MSRSKKNFVLKELEKSKPQISDYKYYEYEKLSDYFVSDPNENEDLPQTTKKKSNKDKNSPKKKIFEPLEGKLSESLLEKSSESLKKVVNMNDITMSPLKSVANERKESPIKQLKNSNINFLEKNNYITKKEINMNDITMSPFKSVASERKESPIKHIKFYDEKENFKGEDVKIVTEKKNYKKGIFSVVINVEMDQEDYDKILTKKNMFLKKEKNISPLKIEQKNDQMLINYDVSYLKHDEYQESENFKSDCDILPTKSRNFNEDYFINERSSIKNHYLNHSKPSQSKIIKGLEEEIEFLQNKYLESNYIKDIELSNHFHLSNDKINEISYCIDCQNFIDIVNADLHSFFCFKIIEQNTDKSIKNENKTNIFIDKNSFKVNILNNKLESVYHFLNVRNKKKDRIVDNETILFERILLSIIKQIKNSQNLFGLMKDLLTLQTCVNCKEFGGSKILLNFIYRVINIIEELMESMNPLNPVLMNSDKLIEIF